MRQRIFEVIQKLHEQVLLSPAGNSPAITRKIPFQTEPNIFLEELALQLNLSESG
jgi:hypothetical protein